MRTILYSALLALCVTIPPGVLAQPELEPDLMGDLCNSIGPPDKDPGALHQACKSLFDTQSPGQDIKGSAIDNSSGVVVAVDDETQTATIQVVRPWLRHKLSATISAMVDKNTGRADFAGFGNQAGAQSLKLEYNYINWPEYSLFEMFRNSPPGTFSGGRELEELLISQVTACRIVAQQLKARPLAQISNINEHAQLKAMFDEAQKIDLPTQDEIDDYFRSHSVGGQGEPPRTEPEKKADGKVQALISLAAKDDSLCGKIGEAVQSLWKKSLEDEKGLTIHRRAGVLGINASIGRKEFSFLDRDLFISEGKVEEISDTEMPRSVGFRAGWVFLAAEGEPKQSLMFSANREKSYEAADPLTYCVPAEGLPPLETCKELAQSAPRSANSSLFSVEYRTKISIPFQLGVALRAFYRGIDDKPDDFGIEIPLYFLVNKDGDLQGGLTLGWRDQDDDGSIAIFVGRKFEIF